MHIISVRADKQMIRINAAWRIADVQYVKPVWNLALEYLIRETMCEGLAVLVQRAVSPTGNSTSP